MQSNWTLHLIRALFVVLASALGLVISWSFVSSTEGGLLGGCVCGCLLVALEASMRTFTIRHFSNAVFGLLIGLFGAFLITRLGLFDLDLFSDPQLREAKEFYAPRVKTALEIMAYTSLGFFGLMIALRSDRDQFALVIPYVRFRRDALEGEPLLLDTNIIIDGRIPKLFTTGFLTGTMIVPRFVLDEMQRLADSHDPIKVERGKRGLHVLEEMRATKSLDLTIQDDGSTEAVPVDTRLVNFARTMNARLLTNDENVAQVARLRGVVVLNLIELTRALQSELLVGDQIEITLVKPGKDKHQAVGYLADGAMIVVNNGAAFMGQTVRVMISGTTQTHAGRLVFADITQPAK
jgi:uncharacterized protein YacL